MSDKGLLMAEAMNYLDDKFIEEAHSEAKGVPLEVYHRKKTIRQVAAIACLCLVAIGVARLPALLDGGFDMSMGEGGNAAPEAEQPIGTIFDDNNDGKTPEKGNDPSEEPPEDVHETETET